MMLGASALAQQKAPDPEAQRAFEQLVQATRARKPFETKTSLVVEAIEGEQSKAAPAVEALLRFDPRSKPPRAAVQVSGFDVIVAGGMLQVTHASNEREYVSVDDDGSPYYALLVAFVDLPYPHIGLVMGEQSPAEVLPQLNSRAGWIVPTKVESIEADAEAGTPAAKVLHLTSEFESMRLELDPTTQGIRSMTLSITGGPMVREGASLRITLKCEERELTDEEAAKSFVFEPGERRRVDSIMALPRLSDPRERGGGGGAMPTLVGQAAPPIGLERFDDGDFDSANYRGRKVIVIDFWATWCGPCRTTLPLLEAAARELEAKGLPAVVAAINTMEGLEGEALRRKVGAFWKDKGFSMVLALDEDGAVAESFGVRGLPSTFVIGLDGVIVWEHLGASEDYREKVIAAVEKALAPRGDDAGAGAGAPREGADAPVAPVAPVAP